MLWMIPAIVVFAIVAYFILGGLMKCVADEILEEEARDNEDHD